MLSANAGGPMINVLQYPCELEERPPGLEKQILAGTTHYSDDIRAECGTSS